MCDPKTTKGSDQSKKKSVNPRELQTLVNQANAGQSDAIFKLIKNLDIRSGKGTRTRTPEEIRASNQKVWDNFVTSLKHLAGETFVVYDLIRLFKGKDPVTGKSSNRSVAAASVLLELVPYVGQLANMARIAKVTKAAGKIDDIKDGTKAAKVVAKVDDVTDATKLTDKIASGTVTADDIVYSNKFKKEDYIDQVSRRGWDNQTVADTINNPVKTTKGYNKYTDSSVTNYYLDDMHYVAVDDSNGKVIQISDRIRTDWRN